MQRRDVKTVTLYAIASPFVAVTLLAGGVALIGFAIVLALLDGAEAPPL